jgi:endonuclease YncB( thermonuclease family)
MKTVLFVATLALLPVQSIAQTVVTDGNTFRFIEGRIVRMFGIDAPESKQVCKDGWAQKLRSTCRS